MNPQTPLDPKCMLSRFTNKCTGKDILTAFETMQNTIERIGLGWGRLSGQGACRSITDLFPTLGKTLRITPTGKDQATCECIWTTSGLWFFCCRGGRLGSMLTKTQRKVVYFSGFDECLNPYVDIRTFFFVRQYSNSTCIIILRYWTTTFVSRNILKIGRVNDTTFSFRKSMPTECRKQAKSHFHATPKHVGRSLFSADIRFS